MSEPPTAPTPQLAILVPPPQSGADPGFPVGGVPTLWGGGRQHTILSNFLKNCMKSRKFWTVGGRVPPPPNPPLAMDLEKGQSNNLNSVHDAISFTSLHFQDCTSGFLKKKN